MPPTAPVAYAPLRCCTRRGRAGRLVRSARVACRAPRCSLRSQAATRHSEWGLRPKPQSVDQIYKGCLEPIMSKLALYCNDIAALAILVNGVRLARTMRSDNKRYTHSFSRTFDVVPDRLTRPMLSRIARALEHIHRPRLRPQTSAQSLTEIYSLALTRFTFRNCQTGFQSRSAQAQDVRHAQASTKHYFDYKRIGRSKKPLQNRPCGHIDRIRSHFRGQKKTFVQHDFVERTFVL